MKAVFTTLPKKCTAENLTKMFTYGTKNPIFSMNYIYFTVDVIDEGELKCKPIDSR